MFFVITFLWDVSIKILLLLKDFYVKKTFLIKSISFENNQIHVFYSQIIFEFVYFYRFTKLLNSWIQYSTSAFDPLLCQIRHLCMVWRTSIGQIILGLLMDFSFRIFSSFAKYRLARMGVTLFPIIIPKICWKYSHGISSNSCPTQFPTNLW